MAMRLVNGLTLMSFLDKYELLEPVTSGTVETFLARQLSSGQRLLVHIFRVSAFPADDPPLEWVMESFRQIAPPPLGVVLEAGRYQQTSSAYLVTKPPDDPAALNAWVRSYNLPLRGVQGARAPTPGTAIEALSVPGSAGSSQPSSVLPGEFTRVFLGSSGAEPVLPLPPAPPVVPQRASSAPTLLTTPGQASEPATDAVRSSPEVAGPFTKLFMSTLDAGYASPLPSSEQFAVKQAPPASFSAAEAIANPAAPATAFAVSPHGRGEGGECAATPVTQGDQGDTGEFTRFFRGPFDVAAVSGSRAFAEPIASSTPAARPPTGEFTKLFGSSAGEPEPSSGPAAPVLESPKPRESPIPVANLAGSLFGQPPPVTASASPKSDGLRSDVPLESRKISRTTPSSFSRITPAAAEGLSAPGETQRPEIPRAGLRFDASAGPAGRTGATEVFAPRDSRSAPPGAAGPSEFTRIISAAPMPPEYSQPDGVPAASVAPAVSMSPEGVPLAMPPKPVAFQFPPPAMPPVPQPPAAQYAWPTQLPQRPPVSYWPLIVLLNILLIGAVAVILFFALKH